MIYIQKENEPESLTKYKKKKFASFDGFKDKNDIREKLLKEQGCLCAYCMRRIDKNHMKIEHWYPEDRLTDVERLDYQNMLGVCLGHIEGTKGSDDTCDTQKGNTIISVNPLNVKTLITLQYNQSTGELCSRDSAIQNDINVTLNLNSERHLLKENRRQLLITMQLEMRKMQQTGNWNKKVLETLRAKYAKPDAEGKKKEYAGVAIWYLDKRLKKAKKVHK